MIGSARVQTHDPTFIPERRNAFLTSMEVSMRFMSRTALARLAVASTVALGATTAFVAPAEAQWRGYGYGGRGYYGPRYVAGPRYYGGGYGRRNAAVAAGIVGLGALGVAAAVAANNRPVYYGPSYAAPVYADPYYAAPVYQEPVVVYQQVRPRYAYPAYGYYRRGPEGGR
jgi:hypothetical protein